MAGDPGKVLLGVSFLNILVLLVTGPRFFSLHFFQGPLTLDGWRLGRGLVWYFLSLNSGIDG